MTEKPVPSDRPEPADSKEPPGTTGRSGPVAADLPVPGPRHSPAVSASAPTPAPANAGAPSAMDPTVRKGSATPKGSPDEDPSAAPRHASARTTPPQEHSSVGLSLRPRPGLNHPQTAPLDQRIAALRGDPPPAIRAATLWAVLATGVLSTLLLGDGVGLNLLIVVIPASLAAYCAAEQAGRRARPWTLLWGAGGVALLAVPLLRDAAWPSFLAVATAFGLGALALHGSRTWAGIALSAVGLVEAVPRGLVWGWRGLRVRTGHNSSRVGPALRVLGVTVGLLLVFGALFSAADAAFADLLGSLVPDMSPSDGPWHLLLLAAGLAGALGAAYTAAAPVRWDGVSPAPWSARGRVEWALPLLVLNALFAAFNAVQLAVLFGGYDAVLDKTGLTYARYARQGFWHLLLATLLVLVVIVVALRWAPRGGPRDRALVRGVLGTLCALTLVVVASAVRRMDMYVEAYGLTRLRISVVTVELWLGVVILLIMAAGVWGARWLPRAVAASAAVGVLAFGLVSPDALIAERNAERYEETGRLDLQYVRELSADAVPALDTLPEPLRSCALQRIDEDLRYEDNPWHATSLGVVRARAVLKDRPVRATWEQCREAAHATAYR